jgi:hypothetical protein
MKTDLYPWQQRRESGNAVEIMLDNSPAMIREKRRRFDFCFWVFREGEVELVLREVTSPVTQPELGLDESLHRVPL